jgi:indolepyruvate ferredoxin oxidoreductase alpha subunit
MTGLVATLREAKGRSGVRVVIAKKPCVINERRAKVARPRYAVDASACTGCRTCLRFGCPALAFEGETASITALCSGCGVCAALCPQGGIAREERHPGKGGAA